MTRNNGGAGGLAGFLERLYAIPGCIPDWFLQLGARVAVAPLFFISGRGKVAGLRVTDSTIFLFEHEFGLPMPVVAATSRRSRRTSCRSCWWSGSRPGSPPWPCS